MSQTVYILSPRTGTGAAADPHRPKVADEYAVTNWTHLTGRRNPAIGGKWSVDSMVISAVVSDAVAAAISADPQYVILFDGEIVTNAKATRIRNGLVGKGMASAKATNLAQMARGSASIGVREIVSELAKSEAR